MGRRLNPKNIASWYNPYELKALFYHAGYDDYGEAASEILHVSCAKSARRKINNTRLTHEDTIELAKALKMTPTEYCRIFLKDVFEDEEE